MLDPQQLLDAKILVVDDQQANVQLLEQMLRQVGYLNVSVTMDPTVVCDLHQTHCYDLILLDLQMPVMDGFAVLKGLSQIESNGYVPVLVITAQPDQKLRALRAGARDFVSKPFDLLEVQTRIHNMLEVRLLYQQLDSYNKRLEATVLARTIELRDSEARFKSFTELSSDWYWEQDSAGKVIRTYGPVFDMLGIDTNGRLSHHSADSDWNEAQRCALEENISARKPFLDLIYSRSRPDGTTQYLQVSGEPIFDQCSRFIGYRGIGSDISARMQASPK